MIKRAPSRSADTERHYQERLRQLANRCARETGVHPTIGELAMWFESRVSALRWRSATFRQYKAALVYETERLGLEDPRALEARDRLGALVHRGFKREKGKPVPNKDKRTSARKQKSFPPEDFAEIQHCLLGGKSSYAVLALSWLRVGLMTGARPDEHFRANVVRGQLAAPFKVALRIRNGKDSNGRAHGEYRHLGLDRLKPKELALLEQHFAVLGESIEKVVRETGRTPAEAFKWLQRTAADRVRRAGIRTWPRRNQRPSMYSTRHQFIADCKAAGISRKALAAMVGHATEETAGKHYARAGSGRNAVAVEPHPAEVLRIRPGRTGRVEALKGKAAQAKARRK